MLQTILAFLIGWIWFLALLAAMFLSCLIPRLADPKKLRREDDGVLTRMIGNPWLPRRVLTPTGERVWVVRNALFGVAAAGIVLALLVGQPK